MRQEKSKWEEEAEMYMTMMLLQHSFIMKTRKERKLEQRRSFTPNTSRPEDSFSLSLSWCSSFSLVLRSRRSSHEVYSSRILWVWRVCEECVRKELHSCSFSQLLSVRSSDTYRHHQQEKQIHEFFFITSFIPRIFSLFNHLPKNLK